MYVLFDFTTYQSYKSNDLQILKNFIKRNSVVSIEWWRLATGIKVLHSDCGRFTIENWGNDLKGIHYFQTIAEGTNPKRQN